MSGLPGHCEGNLEEMGEVISLLGDRVIIAAWRDGECVNLPM